MKIEIWSDFVCPYCYIGKRRLEYAVEQLPFKNEIIIEYNSFELDPDADSNSMMAIHEYLSSKFNIGEEKAKRMNEQLKHQAQELGLIYTFETMKPTNTFDAHRLLQYAKTQQKETEIQERLFKAYFTDGEHIGDHKTLVKIAKEAGLNTDFLLEILTHNDFAKEVRYDQKIAQQLGVQGVPFYVFNEKYAISGAQPIDFLKDAMIQIWEDEKEESLNQPREKQKTTYCYGDDECTEES